MKRLAHVFLILGVTLGILLAACGPNTGGTAPPVAPPPTTQAPGTSTTTAPQSGSWDAVVAAAKKEGTVMVYNGLGAAVAQVIKDNMKQQYGIDVQAVGGTGGELEAKIKTEQLAKLSIPDLFISGWTTLNNVLEARGTQPVTVTIPSLADKTKFKIDPTKYDTSKNIFAYATAITASAAINTDLVRPGEIASWQDLLDPKWKGKIEMNDPRTGSGPGAAGMGIWMKLGEDFWKKMAAQNIQMSISFQTPVDDVVHGAKYMTLLPSTANLINAIQAGAPVKILHMKEGTAYYINGIAYMKNAPHPNAAMVLLNWMFSAEGQTAIGKEAKTFTVRNDLKESWLGIRELDQSTFTFVEPPNNLDPKNGPRGAAFATTAFGPR